MDVEVDHVLDILSRVKQHIFKFVYNTGKVPVLQCFELPVV
jgi:hypothetical protein